MSVPQDGWSGASRPRGGRWVAPVDPPGVLRLFFAVPVPAAAREQIADVIARVQEGVGDGRARIRWVQVAGLHLTLRFLGPTPQEQVEPLQLRADRIARDDAPFEVTLGGGGAFPTLDRPRSLWIGVADGQDRLARIADRLTDAAGECGLVLDTRPFAAHLTIARTDGLRLAGAAARTLAAAADGLDVRFLVDRVVLFRSILGQRPARYEALHEARLGG